MPHVTPIALLGIAAYLFLKKKSTDAGAATGGSPTRTPVTGKTKVVDLGGVDLPPWRPLTKFADQGARWIWSDGQGPSLSGDFNQMVTFLRSFESPTAFRGTYHMVVDDQADVYINDRLVVRGAAAGWQDQAYPTGPIDVDAGTNNLKIVVTNKSNGAGVLFALLNGSGGVVVHTDSNWSF